MFHLIKEKRFTEQSLGNSWEVNVGIVATWLWFSYKKGEKFLARVTTLFLPYMEGP